MSAFGKRAFEGSFSPIYRPMTNKRPNYFRHSVRDLVQAASPVGLKAALKLRQTPDFHRNQINRYVSIYQLCEQTLLSLPILSAALWISPLPSLQCTLFWKLTEINPWFIRGQNMCKLQSVLKAGTGRKRSRHLWLEILKCPWALRWLSSWNQHALLKMV